MAYAELNSPLPNLTLSMRPQHCCGSRGMGSAWSPAMHGLGKLRRVHMLGDDSSVDTTSDDNLPDLTDPTLDTGISNTLAPVIDDGTLPLTSASSITPIETDYPATVGTEFVNNGDGTYTNIQTGQSVPYTIAMQVTAATTPVAGLSTVGTETAVNLTDPVTGQVYNGSLTAAASALQSTGQLVTAAGQLTAAGQALAAQGQLVAQPTSASASVSTALNSLSAWFTNQTLMAGVPNWEVVFGGAVVLMMVSAFVSSRPKKRKR